MWDVNLKKSGCVGDFKRALNLLDALRARPNASISDAPTCLTHELSARPDKVCLVSNKFSSVISVSVVSDSKPYCER